MQHGQPVSMGSWKGQAGGNTDTPCIEKGGLDLSLPRFREGKVWSWEIKPNHSSYTRDGMGSLGFLFLSSVFRLRGFLKDERIILQLLGISRFRAVGRR